MLSPDLGYTTRWVFESIYKSTIPCKCFELNIKIWPFFSLNNFTVCEYYQLKINKYFSNSETLSKRLLLWVAKTNFMPKVSNIPLFMLLIGAVCSMYVYIHPFLLTLRRSKQIFEAVYSIWLEFWVLLFCGNTQWKAQIKWFMIFLI